MGGKEKAGKSARDRVVSHKVDPVEGREHPVERIRFRTWRQVVSWPKWEEL